MALLLRNHDLRGLMDMNGYIAAVERGYREVGLGTGVNVPRQNLWLEGDPNESAGGGHRPRGKVASFKFKAALLPGLEISVAPYFDVEAAAAAHLAATVPVASWPAGFSDMTDTLLTEPYLPAGQVLEPPTGPGLGVEIDLEKLEALARN